MPKDKDLDISPRLQEYCRDMGLKPSDLVSILNAGGDAPVDESDIADDRLSDKTAYAYYNGKRTPTARGLISMADCLGLSLDWLTGRTVYPKFCPQLIEMRRWLAEHAQEIQSQDVLWRIVNIIQQAKERVPIIKKPWFMAGILAFDSSKGLKGNIEAYAKFLVGDGDVTPKRLRRFADFTGLPTKWILSGEVVDFRIDLDMGPWAGYIQRLDGWGITAEEASKNAETLHEAILRQRRMPPNATLDT